MFEKSLYDLIRGLRNHKGNEREYIQASIRECRKEIRTQDMDLKAIAVLKLTYLEMFGHDMSWASFNVLEVMSSPKYALKRVGYLGAVQSFRPDTDILVLAENLLKKDLASPQIPTMSLPLVAIPHVISPSMANSLLSDLLPRLTHSNASVRKKTIVTLYRLALVYPETLRPAWPKIKERLSDENEDPSVTAAVVNVVCELGWRRPQDFLPLAPRLFDLLVDGSNNWMAIKIIKLFATLTPLEPRLVKKLLPPLTSIIKTTPAMSLLYECINGIIQGGILEAARGTTEGDDIARLCVGKLRGMLAIEGDANLKYVSLLAFNRIVERYPHLIAMHEDLIMSCLDDADVSIRLRALDLVVGMVNPDNLTQIVDGLMRQLRNAPVEDAADDVLNDRGAITGVQPSADWEEDDASQTLQPDSKSGQPPPLPDDYRLNTIQRILEMCGRNNYANINDFDWYIKTLGSLVRQVPPPAKHEESMSLRTADDVAAHIGAELQNVAIRVKSSRTEATMAAEMLLAVDKRSLLFPSTHNGGQSVLEYTVWLAGEYASHLQNSYSTLDSLIHSSVCQLPARILSGYIQAVIKITSFLMSDSQRSWTPERKSSISLTTAKVIHFLESLTTHPNLEVQERAVEYLELLRLAAEAASAHEASSDYGHVVDPPLLFTEAIPALFSGVELNPVARDAQRKVPLPAGVDLDQPINVNLMSLLAVGELDLTTDTDDEFDIYYNQRPSIPTKFIEPAASRLPEVETSYQQSDGDYTDPLVAAQRRADRAERYKDDPFYIPSGNASGTSTPYNVLRTTNGDTLDVDSIPIMELKLDDSDLIRQQELQSQNADAKQKKRLPRRKVEILTDENIAEDELQSSTTNPSTTTLASRPTPLTISSGTRSLLHVDSSGLGSVSLSADDLAAHKATKLDIERREAEEAEMAAAMKEVERLRLEMQRKAETIEAPNGGEGVVVKRRVKKKKTDDPQAGAQEEKPKKKKKKKTAMTEPEATTQGEQVLVATGPVDTAMESGPSPTETKISAEPAKTKKKSKRRAVTFENE